MLPTIAVLITCHNRKNKTLSCLKALFDQKGLYEEFTINVFLVDDGSTDGTSRAIQDQFPKVKIIQGTGKLYWNRGMYLSWKTAAAAYDFDYYLWLNDDTFLFQNALEVLLNGKFLNAIICGTTISEITKKATYGGYITYLNKLIVPNGDFQKSDFCNGNCLLIPRNVFLSLGNLDPIFKHALGDFDYSLRASKRGIEIKVAPEYIGLCESHFTIPNWRNTEINVLKRFSFLYSSLSGTHPLEFFIFEKRHFGLKSAIYRFLLSHLRTIFPFIWKFKLNK
jgi:GT2 family glycosyltransferase